MKRDFEKKLREFQGLVRNGENLEEALQAASKAIKCRSNALRIQALYLFEELVEKGVGFNEAIASASLAIKSRAFFEPWNMMHHDIHECGYFLFRHLFEKGQGFEQASALVRSCHKSSNTNIRAAVLMLLKELVDNCKEIDFALQAAVEGVKSRSPTVKWAAFDLFDTLVTNGFGYKEAAAAIKNLKENENTHVQGIAASLAKSLKAI
jgi:hypothetical protein